MQHLEEHGVIELCFLTIQDLRMAARPMPRRTGSSSGSGWG
jgi:hypothetical protein